MLKRAWAPLSLIAILAFHSDMNLHYFFAKDGISVVEAPYMQGNRWDDPFARRARKEGWLARSVYKLQEIDKKYGLIRKG
ncbi:MAG: hypothetical protein GY849_21165, partial [Deltaproteobacteria bacterium]|nr:hypothetical protein [Deltaproteobacteria bacterium]